MNICKHYKKKCGKLFKRTDRQTDGGTDGRTECKPKVPPDFVGRGLKTKVSFYYFRATFPSVCFFFYLTKNVV